jgi:lysozyme
MAAIDYCERQGAGIHVDVPVESFAAFTSFAFNVGVRGFCGSKVARMLNAGDLAGACAGMDAWVYAGGRRVQGLVNRRRQERALCERGLS